MLNLPNAVARICLRDAGAKCVKFAHLALTELRKCPENRLGTKAANRLIMRFVAGLMLLAASSVWSQNVGERMWSPPPTGNFFPLSNTNSAPIPWCPDLPIYYLGVLPGMNGPCYGYYDSSLSGGRMAEDSDPCVR